jgi:hypothetical protein
MGEAPVSGIMRFSGQSSLVEDSEKDQVMKALHKEKMTPIG